MRIRKTRKVTKEVEETTDNYHVCDKCGIRISSKIYDAFEFEFVFTTGDSFPEGGRGDKWELDLCKECAPKAIELLKENGFKVQEKEWSF